MIGNARIAGIEVMATKAKMLIADFIWSQLLLILRF